MADSTLTDTTAAPSSTTKSPGEAPPDRDAIKVNDQQADLCYANFCRVTGTPEELILDFGLNSQPYGTPTEPIEVKQRLVVNYFTAKRMLQALAMSIQRHEQAFGVLETDVQKRVTAKPAPARAASAGG
ncbi:DUF3467 domain-containing protein [Aeoliella sp. ICT_H6.2]|uniref:DUF3467 domain-containing protein n=1 Tax=Aeoliella straminimaris TaxID=2954799 RepID=A0A9X2FGW6_9BACT|nr:DUF3467 domain-containing protein [Aeoliella straminimaris]MCO6044131.1 DUF3467 domain-containing protein [Aeoliella straminimaris]